MSVGREVLHDSGAGHATGESVFIDDRPRAQGELEVGYVGAPVSAGRLKRVDAAKALAIPGVVAVFTAADLRHNRWGAIVADQPLLVSDEIGHIDEPVCVVAAETREALEAARRAISIEVEEGAPVYDIDEAAARGLILYRSQGLSRGDAAAAMARAPHRLSGSLEIGGQEHFYLESQASVVYPLEDGQLEIHTSSQHPTEVQHVCAEALGLRQHQVVCVVKRMGGAFGGKESQAAPFAAMAALVASRLKRAARIVLSKDDDMRTTGKRHPFKNRYEVGFDADGRILALRVELRADGGAYTDLSPSILDRAAFHVDGAYHIPDIRVDGMVCRTNRHSNTAFRGFGGPQGNLTIENILEEIALFLKKDAFEVRRLNVYGVDERNTTHYGQLVENNLLPELFARLHETSGYAERLESVQAFNASRVGKLRGLAMTAVKFGIAFTTRFLNQANALVNVHRDGTVQVSTGATEMGQGVNTKIRQVVAEAFAIETEMVRVMPTSTEKNHNTSPTAASSGADLNGAAALAACEEIKARLAPVAQGAGKTLSWPELIDRAYRERVALGAYGYFRTEGLDFDAATRRGRAFKYFTQGTAVSEVEIDEYTGDLKLRRVDILMDLGRPLNCGIDRGQVVGGFIQGAGWMTTESLAYDAKGRLTSSSPTTYKIPGIQDAPRIFNVVLLDQPGNDGGIRRSKASGEPPLLLSASVLMAVKNALSQRSGSLPGLRCPATPEEILMRLPEPAQG
ncbi:MAG TPA: xanthine dehydrogenase molybdopterin binding subunit [Elusimicrobia bacterium]|nr:MAG: xanthine dehydrogenase molybdopterin binding subunit [Elusimicrobia bacterium GWA2_66_18]OGR72365.1 MAG: xanthine dehydrogenase molybdopterin binding subunit [Elusimicrobia bacterium GWC2_65_9]HAZ08877.1 xanthine dehydrogenase molybdopterin binding subunit [Elusimicrobiota bacterium]